MGSSGKSMYLFHPPSAASLRLTGSRETWEEITNDSLFAVSEPFAGQITRRKPTSDPMPPSGSGKDKILYTEAVGLVMIDYGDAVVGGFGKSTSGASFSFMRSWREGHIGRRLWEGQIRREENEMGSRRKLIIRGQSRKIRSSSM
jgi:hypothetical protein